MARVVVFTDVQGLQAPAPAIQAVELIGFELEWRIDDSVSGLSDPPLPACLIDAREAVPARRELARRLRAEHPGCATVAVMGPDVLPAWNDSWGLDEVLLPGAGPGEVQARLRVARARAASRHPIDPSPTLSVAFATTQTKVAAREGEDLVHLGELVIDRRTWVARLRHQALDLTFREFELLAHLVTHPGRVYSREDLLAQVWGEEFIGGTRTVDVHVRRLRAKLGPEHESLIGTVRNVGYRAVPPARHVISTES